MTTRRDLPDPARLRELNDQRHLPHDHPSDGKFTVYTAAAQARKRMVHVRRTGIVRQIDQLLRSHPGPKSQLSTEALLASVELPRFFGHFAICYPQGGCGLLS